MFIHSTLKWYWVKHTNMTYFIFITWLYLNSFVCKILSRVLAFLVNISIKSRNTNLNTPLFGLQICINTLRMGPRRRLFTVWLRISNILKALNLFLEILPRIKTYNKYCSPSLLVWGNSFSKMLLLFSANITVI